MLGLTLSGRRGSEILGASLSLRSSHPCVQWVLIFASCTIPGIGSLPCEENCWHVDGPAAVVQICLAQLSHKCPLFALHVCWKAPGFHPLCLGSWECRSNISRTAVSPHLMAARRESFNASVETASTLEYWLDFSPRHTATAVATSARKQTPQHLERVRVAPLLDSFFCAVIAWLLAHWAKAAFYVSFITEPSAMRSFFVSSESLRSLSPPAHFYSSTGSFGEAVVSASYSQRF